MGGVGELPELPPRGLDREVGDLLDATWCRVMQMNDLVHQPLMIGLRLGRLVEQGAPWATGRRAHGAEMAESIVRQWVTRTKEGAERVSIIPGGYAHLGHQVGGIAGGLPQSWQARHGHPGTGPVSSLIA